MNTSISKIYRFTAGATGLLVVLFIWKIASAQVHPFILPSPADTYLALTELFKSGELVSNMIITIRRTLIGYGLSIVFGVLLAVILKSNYFWQNFFRPIITISQTIPPVVWITLAVIWFGIADELTPIFLIFIVTFPIIFINVFNGLDNIDYKLVEMGKIYNSSARQMVLDIYIPALIPQLLSAINIGLAFAWKSTVFAEFVGSNSGIGFALSMANNNLQTDRLFVWTVVVLILMFVFEYLIIFPFNRLVMRWKNND